MRSPLLQRICFEPKLPADARFQMQVACFRNLMAGMGEWNLTGDRADMISEIDSSYFWKSLHKRTIEINQFPIQAPKCHLRSVDNVAIVDRKTAIEEMHRIGVKPPFTSLFMTKPPIRGGPCEGSRN